MEKCYPIFHDFGPNNWLAVQMGKRKPEICGSCDRAQSEDDVVYLDNGKTVCKVCISQGFVCTKLSAAECAEAFYQAALEELQTGGENAERLLVKSVETSPTSGALAVMATLSRTPQEAEQLLEKALVLNSAEPVALANMPRVLAAQAKYEAALAWLESHGYPDKNHWTIERARLLRQLGREEEAKRLYDSLCRTLDACCRADMERLWNEKKWAWSSSDK